MTGMIYSTHRGVEIKLGANQIDSAASKLLEIKKYFDERESSSKPSALVIICGLSNPSYKREDGVTVVSINSLKQ